MSTLSRFMDQMMYRLGYTRSNREREDETSVAKEGQGKSRGPVAAVAKEISTVTEAVAKRMVRTGASGGEAEKQFAQKESVRSVGREYQAGKQKAGGQNPERDVPSHPEDRSARGMEEPDYTVGVRPRLQFQKMHPEENVSRSGREPDKKSRRESFFNELKEARVNLWVAGFEELPRSSSRSADEVGEVADAARGNEQESGIKVPIWEINPEIGEEVPGNIARTFSQKAVLSDRHRLVILLSKKPDMERMQDISRHLAETNVQKVLMGGPEMLELMMDYPSVILDDCTQITFLLDSQVNAREKATLSMIQRRIQQETSIPINLECYSQWDGRTPTRGSEVRQESEALPQMSRPALPAPETSTVPSARGGGVYPPMGIRGGGDKGTGRAGEGRYEDGRYLPGRSVASPVEMPVPKFTPTPALTAGYTASNRGNTESQPPTEKQIVHTKSILERMGFNLTTIDESYRKLNIPIGWVGRPVSELFTRLDRQGVSLLIDTLKRMEIEHMKMKAGGMQLPNQPERKYSGAVSPATSGENASEVLTETVPARTATPSVAPSRPSVPTETSGYDGRPEVGFVSETGPSPAGVTGNKGHGQSVGENSQNSHGYENTVPYGYSVEYRGGDANEIHPVSTQGVEPIRGGQMAGAEPASGMPMPQPERRPQIRPFPSGPMR